MNPGPRYAPEYPFPPYSYVTGMWPHPLSDPAGHSYGMTHKPVVLPDQTDWVRCREYCYAVDLWNAGYYWEAHEQWEALWHAAGRTGPTADFFKGLIKLAAAGVKAREGRAEGVQRHLARALQLFQLVRDQIASNSNFTQADCYWGLKWQQLVELTESIMKSREPLAMQYDAEKRPVLRVWVVCLELA